jgi:hypothetical protein
MASGFLGSFLQITVVPKVTVAVLMAEKEEIIVTFVWGSLSFAAVTTLMSIALYHGELLALDWRKVLTRKVSTLCFSVLSLSVGFRDLGQLAGS